MPKISIILPVYNKARHLQETLDAIMTQTYIDYEVIAVDDGSTNESIEILKAFPDARLRIYSQKNQGLSAARNKGIELAQGELIALLDADDLWLSNHLEVIFGLSQKFPDAKLYGTAYQEMFNEGKLVPPFLTFHTTKETIVPDFFTANMGQPLVIPSSFSFSREVVTALGGFDPDITYAEDVDFYIRGNLKFSLAYTPITTCHYRMEGENQITQSRRSDLNPPQFQKYLDENPGHKSLAEYINLKRYFLSNYYKVEGNKKGFKTLKAQINTDLLSKKQRFMLGAPRFVLLALRQIKSRLLKKGKRVTAF